MVQVSCIPAHAVGYKTHDIPQERSLLLLRLRGASGLHPHLPRLHSSTDLSCGMHCLTGQGYNLHITPTLFCFCQEVGEKLIT